MRLVFVCDLRLAQRRPADVLGSLFFFIIVVSLFPLAVSPEARMLRQIGPGVVWVAALLACLLSLPRLFASDHADGTLEQLLLVPQPLALLVLAKVAAHWVTSAVPLIAMTPVIAAQYDLGGQALGVLAGTLLVGTPVLSLLGAVGAALTLGVRGSGVVLSLLVLPLFVPVLIFGAGAVEAAAGGMAVQAHFSLLGACLMTALVLTPWACAAALRVSAD